MQLRITDINQLPYAGVRVSASVPNGILDSLLATTDENGIAVFRWTPASAADQLRAAIEGASISPATVTLVGRPVVFSEGVVNAASYAPGLTPGSLGTIFGTGLSNGDPNAQVLINGVAAPVNYVSDRQVNFVVPAYVTGTSASIIVENAVARSEPYTAAIRPLSPAIFADENNAGAVLIANTGVTTSTRPAKPGDVLEIYATGLGSVQPSTTFPGFQDTITRPQVLIGNVPATVIIATLLPAFPGLYQINVAPGPGTPSGDQPMLLVMNGTRSNEVRVRMQ